MTKLSAILINFRVNHALALKEQDTIKSKSSKTKSLFEKAVSI